MQFRVKRIKEDVVGTRRQDKTPGSVFQVGEILQRSSPGMPFNCVSGFINGVENARVETFGPQDDRQVKANGQEFITPERGDRSIRYQQVCFITSWFGGGKAQFVLEKQTVPAG